MKKILAAFVLIASTFAASASHIVGGYFSYTCTASPGTYEVTLKLYRDCAGINLGNSASIRIWNGAGQQVGSGHTMTLVNKISPMPIDSNACFQPPQGVCVEEWEYQMTITLGPTIIGYYLTYQTCCRNSTVSNILNSGSAGSTHYGTIPNPGQYPCNNSPDFLQYPPIAICENFPIKYDHSALDPDGDSLAYRFCPANNNNPSNVTNAPPYNSVNYSNGYTADSALPGSPGLSIDSITGLLTGTPTVAGQYVVSICVDEFRNGVLIASYIRDFQFNVTECTAAIYVEIPTSGIPGQTGYGTIQSCDDYTVAFGNISVNADSFLWDFGTGNPQDTSHKRYPTFTFPDTGIYLITLIGNPGSLCADTNFAEVVVYPLLIPNFGWDSLVCQGTPMCFYDSTTNLFGSISKYSWSFGDGKFSSQANPCNNYVFAGSYNVQLVIETTKGCRDTATKPVQVFQKPVIFAGADFTVCSGTPKQLTPIYTQGSTLTWSPGTYLNNPNLNSPTTTPQTTITYTATAVNQFGCKATDDVKATVDPAPVVNAGPDVGFCAGSSTKLQGSATHPNGVQSFSWSPTNNLTPTNSLTPTVNPPSTQTYVLTATSANGCVSRDTVLVVVDVLQVNAGPNQIICSGATTTLTATANFPTNYTWTGGPVASPNSASTLATPSQSTAYIVTGTSPGCSDKDTVIVNVLPAPPVDAGAAQAVCPGGSVSLNPSGAVSYVWASAPSLSCTTCTNPQASPAQTTTYYVTGTDANGCVNNDSTVVTIHPAPVVTATADVSICMGESVQIGAFGAQNYHWTPNYMINNNNAQAPTVSPQVTTTYIVTGMDANGCTDTAAVTVTVNPGVPVIAGPDQVICAGDNAPISASNSQTYHWMPGNITTANATVAPMSTTLYTVTGTDSNGCQSKDVLTVTVNPIPVITITPPQGICIGDSLQLGAIANNAATWSWSGAALSASNIPNPWAKPLSTGSYSVTITDNAGCVNSAGTTITVNPLPVVQVSPDPTICEFDTTVISTSTVAQSYHWNPQNGLTDGGSPSTKAFPSTTTRYHLQVIDANGCSDTSSVLINVMPAPPVTAGADAVICFGKNTQLLATGAVSYQWDNIPGLSSYTVHDPIASPTGTTTFVVTGTGANGCTAKDDVMVGVNPLPIINMTPDHAICIGDSTNLAASQVQGSYTWSPGTGLSCTTCATPEAFPTSTTSYSAIVTDLNGCVDSGTVQVTVNPLPVITAGPDTTVCAHQFVDMTALGANTYQWSPADYLQATQGATVTSRPQLTRTYVVEGTDVNGCQNTDQVTLTVMPLPNIQGGINQQICDGDSAIVNATGAHHYLWINAPAGDLSNAPTSAFQIIKPSVSPFTYSIQGRTNFGCLDTAQVTVTTLSLPNINLPPDQAICIGDSVPLVASGQSTQYNWMPATGLACVNCATNSASPAQTTTYTVSGISQFGCRNENTIEVVVNALPVVTTSNDTLICDGLSTPIWAAGGTVYRWNNPNYLDDSNAEMPIATPPSTTTFDVLVTDANGCVNNGSVTVTVATPADPNASPDDIICPGDVTLLSASNGSSYSWTPNDNSLSCTDCPTPIASPTVPTMYTVTIVDGNGCINDATIFVDLHPDPVVEAGAEIIIFKGHSAQLQASGAANYVWTPAESLSNAFISNPVATPKDTTTYLVVGTDVNGCVAEDEVRVVVVGVLEIHMPTAFTPNGDGINDVVKIQNDNLFSLNHLSIYNRWGQLIWSSSDVTEGWDGTLNGQDQPMDNYVFMLEATDLKGDTHKRQGNITLLR